MGFLDQQRQANHIVPNPCRMDLGFNGIKGFFQTYDPDIEDKEKRKNQLKSKKIELIILGYAKKLQYVEKGRGGKPNQSVNSTFFRDYDTDNIVVYENGTPVAQGLYAEIKSKVQELKAKVQDVYFCWSPTLERAVTFTAGGGKKAILNREFKKHGGPSSAPYISLSCGAKVDDDDAPVAYFKIAIDILEVSNIKPKDMERVEEIGPIVVEFLDNSVQRNNEAVKQKALLEAQMDGDDEAAMVGPTGKPKVEETEEVDDFDDDDEDDAVGM